MSKRKMEEFLNDLGVNEGTEVVEPVEEVLAEEPEYEDYLDNDLGSFYDEYYDEESSEFENEDEESVFYDDNETEYTEETEDVDSEAIVKEPEYVREDEEIAIEYEDDYLEDDVDGDIEEIEESEEDTEEEEKWVEDNPDNHDVEEFEDESPQELTNNEIEEEPSVSESIRHVLLKNGESEEENKKEMSTEQMVLQNNREILGGINMENYKSLTNMTLSNGQTKELVKTINGENLRDIISGKILHTVSFIKMPRAEFFEKFLATNMELSDAEKNELMQEYYPSALSGSAVEHIMAVDVDENVITPNKALGEGATPIFWRSSGADLRSYTSKYPEIFGSKVMIPALEIKTPLGETKYRIFISTLHAVLYAEGVTIQEIRDYKYKVSVTNVLTSNGQLRTQGTKDPIQTGLNNGSVRIAEDYLIKYSRL